MGEKTGKYLASAPELASYPPVTASFSDNAQYQAYVFKHAVDQDPPVLDPPEYIAGIDMA